MDRSQLHGAIERGAIEHAGSEGGSAEQAARPWEQVLAAKVQAKLHICVLAEEYAILHACMHGMVQWTFVLLWMTAT